MYCRYAAEARQEPCVPCQTLIHDVAQMCALATESKWPLNVVSPPGLTADRGSNDRIIEVQQAARSQGFNIAAGHHVADITAAKIEVSAYAVVRVTSVGPE